MQTWPSQTPPAPAIQRNVAPPEAWLSAIAILNDPPYLYLVKNVGCAPYISVVVWKCRLPLPVLGCIICERTCGHRTDRYCIYEASDPSIFPVRFKC